MTQPFGAGQSAAAGNFTARARGARFSRRLRPGTYLVTLRAVDAAGNHADARVFLGAEPLPSMSAHAATSSPRRTHGRR